MHVEMSLESFTILQQDIAFESWSDLIGFFSFLERPFQGLVKNQRTTAVPKGKRSFFQTDGVKAFKPFK